MASPLAKPFEYCLVVLDGDVVEDASVDELLQIQSIGVWAKRIDASHRGSPLPRQPYLVRRPKILDACDEQAVQCTGLVGANEKRVPLDNPVDSVIRVVFGGNSQVLRSIPLAAPHAAK